MDQLQAKIARLRALYLHETTMPPGDLLDLLEQLRAESVARMDGIFSMLTALNGRVDQLEKKLPSYTGPRGD